MEEFQNFRKERVWAFISGLKPPSVLQLVPINFRKTPKEIEPINRKG